MKLRTHAKIISYCFVLAAATGMWTAALVAMSSGTGKILLDFNSIGEGWFEVIFIGAMIFIFPVFMWETIKGEVMYYAR